MRAPRSLPSATRPGARARRRHRLASAAAALLGALAAAAPGVAATPKSAVAEVGTTAVAPADVERLPLLADADLSPDGKRVAYVVSRADTDADAFVSELYLADVASGAARKLTPDGGSDEAPRFSPDGKRLALLAVQKGGADQLAVIDLRNFRRRVVTSGSESVAEFSWSPDGAALVFSRLDAAPADSLDSDPIVLRRWQTQWDGSGFLDERVHHLWIAAADGKGERQVTTGSGNDRQPAFSPDGRTIAFVSDRHLPDADRSDDTDLYIVRPDGTDLRRLPSSPGPDDAPRWSHRGDRIAFVGADRANDSYGIRRLEVVSVAGGEAVDLTAGADDGVAAANLVASDRLAGPLWSKDDATLSILVEHRGAVALDAIPSAGGKLRPRIAGPFSLGLARLAPDDGVLALETDPTHPAELALFDAGGRKNRTVSHVADAWLAARRLSSPERLTATSADGTPVDAWLYPPLDPPEPGARAPLVLYVHGGPQTFDGEYFDPDLENQVLPARGFAVLRVNYRGSSSYGDAFGRAIEADWGPREFADLMAALDAALAAHSWLDPSRLGIGGWSYGGILTLWTVAHTDRFRVGVPERFVADYASAFGEDQWFLWYLTELGDPVAHEELYRRLSPRTYLPAVRTPLFLIADEDDRNCPLSQVLQVYQRLKLMGQATELVIYPGEGHAIEQPSHAVDRLERLLGWFGEYLLPGR